MSFYSVFSSTRSSFHSPVYCDPVSRVPPVSSCEKQEKRGLGPGPGRVEDDDDSLPWSEQSGMQQCITSWWRRLHRGGGGWRWWLLILLLGKNLYTYICWAQRSRSGRCRSRNQTLPWVWFGCWFVSGLPLKTGFVFIFFLCYCLRSLILAPATLSDLHLILILRLLASPVGRSFCPVLRLVSDDEEDEAGWLGSQALQFTATDSQQNRLWDWSWNAITINKCRKDTVKRSGEESEILINKSH